MFRFPTQVRVVFITAIIKLKMINLTGKSNINHEDLLSSIRKKALPTVDNRSIMRESRAVSSYVFKYFTPLTQMPNLSLSIVYLL